MEGRKSCDLLGDGSWLSHKDVWAGKSCGKQLLLKEVVDACGAFFPLSVSPLSADVVSNPVVARAGEEMPSPLVLWGCTGEGRGIMGWSVSALSFYLT